MPPGILTFLEKLVTLVLARDANYIVFHKPDAAFPEKVPIPAIDRKKNPAVSAPKGFTNRGQFF
jgi:hypothetical protein